VYFLNLYREISYSNLGIYPHELVARKSACGRQDIHDEFVIPMHKYMGMRKRKKMAGEMKSAGSQKIACKESAKDGNGG
jgi:hypothetical protein